MIVFHNRFGLLLCQFCLEQHLNHVHARAEAGAMHLDEPEAESTLVEHPLIPRTIELSPGGARVRVDGKVSEFIVIKGVRYQVDLHPSVNGKNAKGANGHDTGE